MVKTLTIAAPNRLNERNYMELIVPYVDAMQNMLYRIEALNKDFSRKYQNDPIHHIQSRIKTRESLEGKLRRLQMEPTVENARDLLTDIAGIRVICYFIKDIDWIVDIIKRQRDLIILKERDYIRYPKSNGYRSYHIVFGIPVYHTDGMDYYPVELQLRTMSMDFWASMEHRICYKKEPRQPIAQEMLVEEFFGYAKQLEEIEAQMEKYCEKHPRS
ncbi:MAG: (p)ppGpp synthetase [Lachnospiraceae bacterium]|nr:(p)ppGpp synthetase [Lachnospiraceae bacterium]